MVMGRDVVVFDFREIPGADKTYFIVYIFESNSSKILLLTLGNQNNTQGTYS